VDEFGTIITPNEKEEILNKMKELIDTSPDKAMQYLGQIQLHQCSSQNLKAE